MKYRRLSTNVIVLTVGTMLLAAVVSWSQKHGIARDESKASKSSSGATHAENISAEFRRAANAVLPGIVSIETYGQTVLRYEAGPEGSARRSGAPLQQPSLFQPNPQNGQHESVMRTQGHASGFVIDGAGLIMTSAHVLENADRLIVRLSDGQEYAAVDAKGDPASDIAIVRIKPRGKLHTLHLGDSDALEIGDWVLAVGSPFGLDLSVTAGIISAKHRGGAGVADREDFLQTDAAVNPGNSGGPLVNLEGEVVGVNSAIATRSGGYEGISFAVPIDAAKWVADQLASKGSVRRAWMGIAVQAIDDELARHFKLKANHGVIVTHVAPHSPASDAKLEAGDVILRLGDKSFHKPRDLVLFAERLPVGRQVPLVVLRQGKELHLEIEPRELPHEGGGGHARHAEQQARPAGITFEELGIAVGELSPEMAHELGYSAAAGAAILAVEPGGIAAQAGLEPRMIIDKVGPHAVTDAAQFRDAIKGLSVTEGIALLVRTPRGSRYVVLRESE